MDTFVIGPSDEAVKELATTDLNMKKLINVVGELTVPMRPDYFKSLVRSIIGQQISVQAANAVFGRLEALVEGNMTPEAILHVPDDQFRAAGLSGRKIVYLRDLTANVYDNTLDFDRISELDNQSVIKQLTRIKGIGKWTAEMFLIFSLGRMNVLAVDDIGLQRGAKWLYNVDRSERRKILLDKKPVWEPHLTIASFYLWEVVHLGFDKTYLSIDDIT
ncbi:DNA-3-methyladenine glycosylase family protein [Lentibacillus salinarum]|uniref:DNA-3-methyladenine glycosylase II n=1 Tax=Lentibacillus salinarum TaxID=446820 RepID=A0ABW3ZZX8_9BACI